MNAFEGMSKQEFRLLVQEAITIQHRAHLLVLSNLVEQLLEHAGTIKIEELKPDDYIRIKTKEAVHMLLGVMADHDPGQAAKISRFLETLDFY